MNKYFYSLILFLCITTVAFAQSVSIAPSRLYFKQAPGSSKTQTLKITNSSKNKQSLEIKFGDFEATGSAGKSTMMKPGESPHSITKYISANPNFVEVEPGQTKEVQILLDLPNIPDAAKVKWGTVMISLVRERKSASAQGGNNMGMGILETFQFVVHVFQTPPNITNRSAEIVEMKQTQGKTPSDKVISILTKNTGEAVLDCASYIDIVSLKTGKKERLKPTAFTILPGGSREVKFPIPATLEKGKYSATGVIDYGSKDDVQAAEMDLEI